MDLRRGCFLCLTFLWVSSIFAQDNSCGSLITYRQYSVLLDSAPRCFRDGCNQPEKVSSMSSECPKNAPCGHLWEFLRLEWQEEWCAECNENDKACRTRGWPILNATSACDVSPQERLFGAQGACCVQRNQPFELADWMGKICNGSEWREDFASYGGMAKEDWEEWIEPWNWTVKPHNTSTKNFTLEECDSPEKTLAFFGTENAIIFAEAVVELTIAWICLHLSGRLRNWAVKDVVSWQRSFIGGIVSGALIVMTNFTVAIFWHSLDGYEDIPPGRVGLALCARPSALGFICFLGLLYKPASKKILEWKDEKQEEICQDETRISETGGSWALRWKTWAKKKLFGPKLLGVDQVVEASQLMENWALMISISELIVQLMSCYSTFKTTDVGTKRGFFVAGALRPFWRGGPAHRMYAGAIFHCIAFVPSVASLFATATFHARKIRVKQRIRRNKAVQALKAALNVYYRDEVKDAEHKKIMVKQQLALMKLLKAKDEPVWMKVVPWAKDWIAYAQQLLNRSGVQKLGIFKRATTLGGAIKRTFARWVLKAFPNYGQRSRTLLASEQNTANSVQQQRPRSRAMDQTTELARAEPIILDPGPPAQGERSPTRLPTIEESELIYSEPDRRSLIPWHRPAPRDSLAAPPGEAAYPPIALGYTPGRGRDAVVVRRAPRPRYQPLEEPEIPFLGRVLSRWPFSSVVKRLHAWSTKVDAEERRRLAGAELVPGPNEQEFRDLERIMAEEETEYDNFSFAKRFAYAATFFFVTINYLSQWLFWSGYVESSGQR